MANEHPFQTLIESLGQLPSAHAEAVNRQAYHILRDILTVSVEQPGRCILLRAPRAGHGKTHLLSRIEHQLGASHEFIPLHAAFGCQIHAGTVMDDALRSLLRALPASSGLCVLDLIARRIFATALEPLVRSGDVPCQNREEALTALQTRPLEIFDFHHPNAVTAHWARENFALLSQRFSVDLAQRCNLPIREVAFWVDALFQFVAAPVENTLRLRVLTDAIHSGNPGDNGMMERLEALLSLLALLGRVVLVADNLEGFSSNESAALQLAAFLGTLRQSVARLDIILSLNQDIWENAFMPKLSDGLSDRLSEVVVELNPLTEEEMLALLESRVPGLGSQVLARVDRSAAGTHARGLIRAAGVAWLRASARDSSHTASAMAPVATAAPVIPLTPVIPATPAAPRPSTMTGTPAPPASPAAPRPSFMTGTPAPPATPAAPRPSFMTGTPVPPASPAAPISPVTPIVTTTPVTPETAEPPATSAPPDTDRVDRLLQQFLERYGPSSR